MIELVVGLALAMALTSCAQGADSVDDPGGDEGAVGADSVSVPAGVAPLFWDVMSSAGASAGRYDAYRQCLEPDAGVELFDVEQFGGLVNPAYDDGYVRAGTELLDRCGELTSTHGGLTGAARDAHRQELTGFAPDTVDAHPDFGKGSDLGRMILVDFGCDSDRARDAAGPPESWLVAHDSEFLNGYVSALTASPDACPSS